MKFYGSIARLLHGWKSTYWKLGVAAPLTFRAIRWRPRRASPREHSRRTPVLSWAPQACRPLTATDAAKIPRGRTLISSPSKKPRFALEIAKPLDNTDFDMTWAQESHC